MTPAKTPLIAAAALLCAMSAGAQPRTGDVTVPSAPSGGPTVSVSPTVTPGLGAGSAGVGVNAGVPGAGVNAGVNLLAGAQARTGAAAVPSAGAAAVGAPTQAQLESQAARLQGSAAALPGQTGSDLSAAAPQKAGPGSLEASFGAADPGAALMRPGAQRKDAARAASGSAALDSAVSELGRAQKLEAAGLQGTTAEALDRVFDAAGKHEARVGDRAAGSVAGKTERVRDQVRQTVRIADTASAHDAPALYKDAIRIAEQAALKKLISDDTARAVADTVVRYAYRRAARALPDLANEAYKAAALGLSGKPAVEKDFRSLGAWEQFLGGGEARPLIANEADLRADVQRTLDAAQQAGAGRNGVPPRVTFRREGDSFVAELPMRAAGAAAALPQDFLKSLALAPGALGREPAPALVLTQTPGILEGARLLYSAARRGGRSSLSATGTAVSFAARATLRSLWERLSALVSALIGRLLPGRVDLGAGQTLVSYDRHLSRLSALKRQPTDEEREFLSRRHPRAAAVFLDLSRLEREARAAEQAASRGARTAGALKAELAALDSQAKTYAELSGDASALAAAASLRARAGAALALADDAPLPEDAAALAAPETAGGIAFWLSRLPQATLDFVDRQMLAAAAREGLSAVAYSDLSAGPDASVRLVAPEPTPALAAELEGLGFETELGSGGALRAWAGGAGLAQRLDSALDQAGGASAPSADDVAAVAAAAQFAAAHPAEARKQAQRLQAEDPSLTGFSPAGLVESQGRPLWAESAVRKIGGKLSRVVLLRDLDTRRPLFGRAEPLPAR